MTARDTGAQVDGRNYSYESSHDFTDVPEAKRINRDTAERCLFFLAQSAEPHAAWAARRRFLDKYVGIVLAMEERNDAGSEAAKTRKAKKSIPYMRVLRDLEEAIYHETLLTGLRNAAEKKFSGWQTLNANLRTGVNL